MKPSGQPFDRLSVVLLVATGLFFVLEMWLGWQDSRSSRSIKLGPKYAGKIERYMAKWVSRGGRVSIVSRDLSWAKGRTIKSLLAAKAAGAELEIYVPHRSPIVDKLESAGALVFLTGMESGPAARFTIVNSGRADADVAIGRTVAGRHQIEEFAVGASAVGALTQDLLAMARQLADST